MRAVGGDEVDDGGRVLEVQREVQPARVGLELRVAVRGFLELRAGGVQRRHAGLATAGDVQRREVQRDADELVAQHVGDELVDLVADLAGHAADDGAGGDLVADRVGAERDRVQEGLEQVHALVAAVRAVAATWSAWSGRSGTRLGELGEDGRVDVDGGVEHEDIDVRLDLAGEFLEDEVLVLHLRGEPRGLEQALAVPGEGVGEARPPRVARRQHGAGGRSLRSHSLRKARSPDRDRPRLHLLDRVVVLRMEDVVHRREADVLVAAPVAGDVVRVEQFVVVEAVRRSTGGCEGGGGL